MKQSKLSGIDVLILVGMFAIVFFLCHPLGRNWNDVEKEMFTGEEGIYSCDPDSYYYLRRAKEFTEGGVSSIRMMYSRSEDPRITAVQTGKDDSMPQLLSAFAALIWFGFHAVGIKVGIFRLAVCLNAILLALFVVPTYLFLRKRVCRIAAVFGALVVPLLPPFFRHSYIGYFDTDAMIGLLALIMILSLFECVLSTAKKRKIIYGILSCIALVLLYYTWTAFFVYAVISVGITTMGMMAVRVLRRQSEDGFEHIGLPIVIMFAITAFSLALGAKSFWSLAEGYVFAGRGNKAMWPDVTLFISELKKPAFDESLSLWYSMVSLTADYSSYFGGMVLFSFLVISVVICVYAFVKRAREKRLCAQSTFLFFALGIWLAGSLVMSSFGIRYMEFVALPSGLVMAFGLDEISKIVFAKRLGVEGKRVILFSFGVILFSIFVLIKPMLAVIVAGTVFVAGFFVSKLDVKPVIPGLLAAVLLSALMESACFVTKNLNPFITQIVVDGATWFEKNTSEDAVIADFWSLGYIYQYYGNRRTIADGGTYNGEFFYWLGTMIATDNPKLSVGIARMLQQGGIDGSEYACTICNSPKEATELLKVILVLSRVEAQAVLREKNFDEDTITKLLNMTHPERCPDIYFVANQRIFLGMSSLPYYRDWEFGETEVPFLGETLVGEKSVLKPKDGEVINCHMRTLSGTDELEVYLSIEDGDCEAWASISSGAEAQFSRIVYYKDGEKKIDQVSENDTRHGEIINNAALMVFEDQERLSFVVCDETMPDSVLVNLYVLNGAGQSVFEKVYEVDGIRNDESRIQRLIGADKLDGGVSIWQVHFD